MKWKNLKIKFLIIFLLVFILFLVSALRCWRCSSDASGVPFCNDPFDQNIITEHQKRWSLVECLSAPQSGYNNPLNGGAIGPYQPNQRPVCKKVKQYGK